MTFISAAAAVGSRALSTWVLLMLAVLVIVPPLIWSLGWVLRFLLTILYAVGGNAPASFEGVW